METDFQKLRNFTNNWKKYNCRNSFYRKTTTKVIFSEKKWSIYKKKRKFEMKVYYFCVLCSYACYGMFCVLLTIKKNIKK